MTPRRVLVGWFAAMLAVHAIVGVWQPLQSDDWTQLLWGAAHDSSWLASHFTLADAAGYALPRSVALHAVVSALASAALVLGVFVVAMRRLPRDTWDDTIGVIAGSALIWIAQPHAGLVWFHRPHVAAQICGAATALWLIAPFRCGWRVRGAGPALLVIAGLLAGTSTRQIASATLIGLAIAVWRTPAADRARWMAWALGGLFVGTVAGFLATPHVAILRVLNRGLEPNLVLLNLPIRETGQLIALLLLLTLARLGLDALRPPRPEADADPAAGTDDDALPPPRETLRWLGAWFAICVACLFGPRYSEATLLPATLVLVIAALPYVDWLCRHRALRAAVIAIVAGVHLVVWITALTVFARFGGEFRDRMARLTGTPPGEVAVISPYSEVLASDWFFGEDWSAAARQLAGIELFGVRDIAFDSRFSGLEANPGIAIRPEVTGVTGVTGVTPAQLRAASPALWATDVATARDQFEVFVHRLARTAGTGFAVHLVADVGVDRLAFTERAGRPLEVAWYEHGALTAPGAARASNVDVNDRLRITLPAEIAAAYPEAYLVRDGHATRIAYAEGAYKVQPMVAGLYAVIACSPARCLLVDAFIPRF